MWMGKSRLMLVVGRWMSDVDGGGARRWKEVTRRYENEDEMGAMQSVAWFKIV